MYNAEKPSRMKKIILLLLLAISAYGQNSEKISDGQLCGQIKSAIKYLKADKELKTRNFRFDSKIGNGWNYDMFSSEYVAHQLGVKKEKIFDLDKSKAYPIYKKLENTKRKISDLELDCVKKKRKPNAELSKFDNDNLLISQALRSGHRTSRDSDSQNNSGHSVHHTILVRHHRCGTHASRPPCKRNKC